MLLVKPFESATPSDFLIHFINKRNNEFYKKLKAEEIIHEKKTALKLHYAPCTAI